MKGKWSNKGELHSCKAEESEEHGGISSTGSQSYLEWMIFAVVMKILREKFYLNTD